MNDKLNDKQALDFCTSVARRMHEHVVEIGISCGLTREQVERDIVKAVKQIRVNGQRVKVN